MLERISECGRAHFDVPFMKFAHWIASRNPFGVGRNPKCAESALRGEFTPPGAGVKIAEVIKAGPAAIFVAPLEVGTVSLAVD